MTNLQSVRLAKLADKIYHNVEYYGKEMRAVGLEPGDTRGTEDLDRLLFTTKDDSRDTYPFDMFTVPNSQITHIHASSGITGRATVVGHTRKGIDVWSEYVAGCITMVGLGRDDAIRVVYGYGLFTSGLETHYGTEEMGATAVPVSTGNTKKLIIMMVDFGVADIMRTPFYLLHIAETIGEIGAKDQIKLKAPINGVEPWTDKMRTQIEHQLGVHAYDIYGLSEITGLGVTTDCQCHAGPRVHEDHFLPETADQYTLKPLRDGMEDELAIFMLTKRELPLIRYRTKDLASLGHGSYEHGRTTARIARFIGRMDDMLITRDVGVFPPQIELVFLEMGGITPHYLFIMDGINNPDTLEVRVEVEKRLSSDRIRELGNPTGEIAHVI